MCRLVILRDILRYIFFVGSHCHSYILSLIRFVSILSTPIDNISRNSNILPISNLCHPSWFQNYMINVALCTFPFFLVFTIQSKNPITKFNFHIIHDNCFHKFNVFSMLDIVQNIYTCELRKCFTDHSNTFQVLLIYFVAFAFCFCHGNFIPIWWEFWIVDKT